MNKLLIDNDTDVEDITVTMDQDIYFNFENISKRIIVNIMDGVCSRIIDTSNGTKNEIIFNIGSNDKVIVNKLSKNSSDHIIVNLNGEKTTLKLNSSIINYNDNTYKEDIIHSDKNIESKIVNHCINMTAHKFNFIVNGIIKKESDNCIFKQDNKIINKENGNSSILPNLIVDNNEVEASHSAYIGSYDEQTIFYLMSRGIPRNTCENLLTKAFLIHNMDLDSKEIDIFNSIIENI